jgi:amino acid permease
LNWQLIVISGTIGMGLFQNSGEILHLAGPGGGITAFGVVGLGVIAVMEGIAEMVTHWPISNSMIEFVRVFIDKELAIVIGIAYALGHPGFQSFIPLLILCRYAYSGMVYNHPKCNIHRDSPPVFTRLEFFWCCGEQRGPSFLILITY